MEKLVTKETLKKVVETIANKIASFDTTINTFINNFSTMDNNDNALLQSDLIEVSRNKGLTFYIVTGGTINWKRPDVFGGTKVHGIIYYKINNETEWHQLDSSNSTKRSFSVNAGDVVHIGGDNYTGTNADNQMGYSPGFTVSEGCTFWITGNILSLVNKENFSSLTELTAPGQFNMLFYNCTGLLLVKNLYLPTNTTPYCYNYMFNGCSSLIGSIELPATLTTANCYCSMFRNTQISDITVRATNIASNAFNSWLDSNTISDGVIRKSAALELPTGASGVPEGWTTVEI